MRQRACHPPYRRASARFPRDKGLQPLVFACIHTSSVSRSALRTENTVRQNRNGRAIRLRADLGWSRFRPTGSICEICGSQHKTKRGPKCNSTFDGKPRIRNPARGLFPTGKHPCTTPNRPSRPTGVLRAPFPRNPKPSLRSATPWAYYMGEVLGSGAGFPPVAHPTRTPRVLWRG